MNFVNPPNPADIGTALEMEMAQNVRVMPRVQDAHREASATTLNSLLDRVSESSMREIDNLIDELQTVRGQLQSDTDRIRQDIAKYAAVSDEVMQLTKIISESVQKLPNSPSIAG
jgi:ABC-type transporter Mla subunit MlaD